MGHVLLIFIMFNITFLFILYKLEVMKVFLSSSQHYDIIASDVILNPSILHKYIVLTSHVNTFYNSVCSSS